jgi:hypothetical protein
MQSGSDLSVGEIAAMLRPHAESLAWSLFPAAKRDGAFLCVGSLHGEAGKSLKIKIRGADAGAWADYATSQSDPRGKGDLIKLLQYTVAGGDLGAAVAEAKRFLSIDSMDPRKLERHRMRAALAAERSATRDREDKDKARRDAEGLWQASAKLTPSSPPVLYLAGRSIDLARLGKLPGALRFRSDFWHPQLGKKLPAMLTKMQTLDGQHAATHATYLERQGDGRWTKLTFEGARRMGLPDDITAKELRTKSIRGPAHTLGAHMALWKGASHATLAEIPAGVAVEVSEGIEDGLSFALANPEARVIAAGTLGIIGQLLLPGQCAALNVLAQNDDKPEPIAALERAIADQQARAKADKVVRHVACRFPPPTFKDWNDWLRGVEK